MNDELNDGFERFSLSQAAKELGVSVPSARRLIFSGKLQGFKVKKGEKERWEVRRSEVFRLKHSGDEVVEAITEEPDENWVAPATKRSRKHSEAFEASEAVPLTAHLAALDLARAQIERLAHQVEESQRMMLNAERARMAIEAQTQHQVAQYQRILSEQAESLAEERALRMSLELQKQAEEATRPPSDSLDQAPPVVDTPTKRRGWGSRLKGWLLGEKAV